MMNNFILTGLRDHATYWKSPSLLSFSTQWRLVLNDSVDDQYCSIWGGLLRPRYLDWAAGMLCQKHQPSREWDLTRSRWSSKDKTVVFKQEDALQSSRTPASKHSFLYWAPEGKGDVVHGPLGVQFLDTCARAFCTAQRYVTQINKPAFTLRLLGFKSLLCHFLALWSQIQLLSLSPPCEVAIMIIPSHIRIKLHNTYKLLRHRVLCKMSLQ